MATEQISIKFCIDFAQKLKRRILLRSVFSLCNANPNTSSPLHSSGDMQNYNLTLNYNVLLFFLLMNMTSMDHILYVTVIVINWSL
jgi:hypothetical protein